MKVDLIATRNSPYGGKIKKGDLRRVSPREAKVLLALGHAVPATKVIKKEVKEPKRGEYMRRDMTAEPRSVSGMTSTGFKVEKD